VDFVRVTNNDIIISRTADADEGLYIYASMYHNFIYLRNIDLTLLVTVDRLPFPVKSAFQLDLTSGLGLFVSSILKFVTDSSIRFLGYRQIVYVHCVQKDI